MRRLALVVLVVLVGLGVGVAVPARSDCCMGPPVWVHLPINTPLAATIHPVVSNDDPDRPGIGSVHAYLNVGGRRVADLGSVDTTASIRPHEITFRVPAEVRRRARRLAVRGGGKPVLRGVVKFVIRSRDAVSGTTSRTYGAEGFVSLVPSVKVRRPVRISLGKTFVVGAARERLRGFLLLRVPLGWPRTSPVGSEPTTFGPLAIGSGNCTAHVYAWTRAVATTNPAGYIAEQGGRGTVVAGDAAGLRRWQIRAADSTAIVAHTTAISIHRIAAHRYAGVRLDAVFSPRCAPQLAREPALIRALRNAVTTLKVDARKA